MTIAQGAMTIDNQTSANSARLTRDQAAADRRMRNIRFIALMSIACRDDRKRPRPALRVGRPACCDHACRFALDSRSDRTGKPKARMKYPVADEDEEGEPGHDLEHVLSELRGGGDPTDMFLSGALYQRLHRIAVGQMRGESRRITLQPTVLVHEVVMQLIADAPALNDREHLCALAARMMRHYLINHAKRRRAQRHGGDAVQVTLNNDQLGTPDVSIELVALGQALEALEAVDARKAEVLDLFYFGGMTYEEIAETLAVSRATVTRELRIGRAFVTAQLDPERR